MRPLGIPTIWDRIIQQCFLQVLEPICEAKFFERSNGFRPNRSVENAIAQSYKMMQMYKLHYVVDVDIKGFFDNVNHGKLLKQLWAIGIRDKRVIAMISKMLKAEVVMPDKSIVKSEKGILKKRLNLEISEDKSKITNLRKEYSEFLGFKMKVYQKGDKWKVKSHMCDKAYDRTRKELKEAMDVIKDTEGSANTGRAISIYNAKVIGIHQYFQLATMISEDVSKISYEIQHKCKSRKLERRIEQTGRTKQGYIEKIYGASKQLRYINEVAIAPIGYCKHKNPMYNYIFYKIIT